MRVRGPGTTDESPLPCCPIGQQMDMQIPSINRMIIFSRFEIRLGGPRKYAGNPAGNINSSFARKTRRLREPTRSRIRLVIANEIGEFHNSQLPPAFKFVVFKTLTHVLQFSRRVKKKKKKLIGFQV